MTHHVWGETDFDWDSLHKACGELHDNAHRYGRLGIATKEKWGCLRASTWFWDGSLHSLIWPGYVYTQWSRHFPKSIADCLWSADVYFWPKLTRYSGVLWLARKWQRLVYGWAYRRVVAKYPHIADEILHDAEYPELISWEAQGVHGAYWEWTEK